MSTDANKSSAEAVRIMKVNHAGESISRHKIGIKMMKTQQKNIIIFLFCLFMPLCCFAEPSANPLVGVWQHSTFVQTADGIVVRKYESTDGSTLEFRANGTWHMNSPPHQSSGTYRWASNERIESTITSSDYPKKQIGYTSMKRATVYDRTLVLISEYDEEGMKVMAVRPDGTRPKSMTVTSTFRKIIGNK